jgi:hypothetical protein
MTGAPIVSVSWLASHRTVSSRPPLAHRAKQQPPLPLGQARPDQRKGHCQHRIQVPIANLQQPPTLARSPSGDPKHGGAVLVVTESAACHPGLGSGHLRHYRGAAVVGAAGPGHLAGLRGPRLDQRHRQASGCRNRRHAGQPGRDRPPPPGPPRLPEPCGPGPGDGRLWAAQPGLSADGQSLAAVGGHILLHTALTCAAPRCPHMPPGCPHRAPRPPTASSQDGHAGPIASTSSSS